MTMVMTMTMTMAMTIKMPCDRSTQTQRNPIRFDVRYGRKVYMAIQRVVQQYPKITFANLAAMPQLLDLGATRFVRPLGWVFIVHEKPATFLAAVLPPCVGKDPLQTSP